MHWIRTFGIVIVEIIVLDDRFQRRKVLARWIPNVGFKMVTGTTKSEVRIMFFLKSTLSPWGENCSPRMLSVLATSSGHSWMMLKLASVSMRRPGDVPTAARTNQQGYWIGIRSNLHPMYVIRNPLLMCQPWNIFLLNGSYPSGLARISSVIELRMALLLFLNVGWYGLETSK